MDQLDSHSHLVFRPRVFFRKQLNMADVHSSPETRPTLLQRVVALDPQSWNEFVTLYEPLVLAYIGDCAKRYHITLDTHDCEDIKQDVLIGLSHKLSTFNTNRRFRTWLWAVVRNAVIDWARKRWGRRKPAMPRPDAEGDRALLPPADDEPRLKKVSLTPEMEDSLASDADTPDKQLIQAHDHHMLRTIMENVKAEMESSPKKWECFAMHYLEGKPRKEVAAKLDVSIELVYTNIHRVLACIREKCQYYDVIG